MEVTLVEINVQPEKVEEFLEVFHANHLGAVQGAGKSAV